MVRERLAPPDWVTVHASRTIYGSICASSNLPPSPSAHSCFYSAQASSRSASRPAAEDPFIDPRAAGAGASSVVDGWTGLQRDFPAVDAPADTPQSDDAVELGRLLFFDPVLSFSNDQSCATCHHPDHGLADGQMHPVTVDGRELPRHTPTLWNVAYAGPLFWDGRAETLEDQAHTPLTHPDEMANDPDELVAKLRAIPEYVERFNDVFPAANEAGGVTFDNVARALAAFQRTLISSDSRFDRFAAGDRAALSESHSSAGSTSSARRPRAALSATSTPPLPTTPSARLAFRKIAFQKMAFQKRASRIWVARKWRTTPRRALFACPPCATSR